MSNRWLEDFNKEVEEALSRLKTAKPRSAGSVELLGGQGSEALPSLQSGIPERLELSRLELAVSDMRRRLDAQGARLEAETASREELQERIRALTAGIREADEKTAALRREAAARAARAKELEDTVLLAEKARTKLSEVLKEERSNAAHWRSQAEALKSRLDSLWPALEKKEKELSETLSRYDEICRSIKEETGQRLKEVRFLTSEAEKARGHEAEMRSQVEVQSRALEEERSRLLAQANQSMENAEAIRRDAVHSLEEARELRAGAPPSAVKEEQRRSFDAQAEGLRKENSRLRSELEARERSAPAKAPSGEREKPAAGAGRFAGRYLILAGFLAAAAVSAWLSHRHSKSHAVPFSHPTALVWQGDTLWASDWYDESVYRMRLENGKLGLVRRYPLPGVHIAGMAVAGDVLYLVDSWSREIQRRKMDDALSLESSVRSPGTSPSALFHDGSRLWSADNSGALYEHAGDRALAVLASYPGSTPAVAIEADQDRVWLAEGRTRTFYARRRDKSLSAEGAFGFKELDAGAAPLSCFARRGGKLWLGRDGSKFLLELPAGSLSPRPAAR